MPILRFGDKSQEVLNIQNKLLKLGYFIQPTSIFDRQTLNNITLFQFEHGLSVDGSIGDITHSKILSIETRSNKYSIDKYHNYIGGIYWLTDNTGIKINDSISESYPKWTDSLSLELPNKVYNKYKDLINRVVKSEEIPKKIIISTICTESGGDPSSKRFESHLDDTSYGLMQILYKVAKSYGFSGKPEELSDPFINLSYAGKHIKKFSSYHRFDPILIAAIYNSGHIRYSPDNRWHIKCAVSANGLSHLDKFTFYYNSIQI